MMRLTLLVAVPDLVARIEWKEGDGELGTDGCCERRGEAEEEKKGTTDLRWAGRRAEVSSYLRL